jgi:hypothetical protein
LPLGQTEFRCAPSTYLFFRFVHGHLLEINVVVAYEWFR